MKRLTALVLMLGVIGLMWAIELKPEDFGAVIDDGKPDHEAFQKIFDAIPDKERNVLNVLQPGEYTFKETVFYPKYTD